MSEQRLIDANNLGVGKANPDVFERKDYAYGWNSALQAVTDAAHTIDPETLTIVQELRAEIADMKERFQRLKYWDLERSAVLESAAQDRAAVNVMRKHCEKTIADLRKELKQVTAERDALLSVKTYTTTRYDGNTLEIYRHDCKNLDESQRVVRVKYTATTTDVGYSESGKEGPYQIVMNQDEFGILTMAQEIADALFANQKDVNK